jgi:hypothetical protein
MGADTGRFSITPERLAMLDRAQKPVGCYVRECIPKWKRGGKTNRLADELRRPGLRLRTNPGRPLWSARFHVPAMKASVDRARLGVRVVSRAEAILA